MKQSSAEHWPHYAEDEVAAAVACLTSGRVNQWTGDQVRAFEADYAAHVGVGQAIALANGSLALELALRVFDIGPGDEVIVTPRSFVASASCVALVGATPVFADVEPDSGNVSAATVAEVVTPRTKAIVPVHLAGWPVEMAPLMALAKEHGLVVVEDCAQAHGATIDGRPVGSFGDAAAFSFCQDKIITTGGEGGMLILRDADRYDRAWSFKDHGKSRAKAFAPAERPGFRWLHDSVGTNWRMLEMSAAIGRRQLAKLARWRETRASFAAIWRDALAGLPGVTVPLPRPGLAHGWYRLSAYLDDRPGVADARDALIGRAADAGLRLFSGTCPELYREGAFRDLAQGPLPVAARLGRTSLVMETHPTLDADRLAARASAVAGLIARL